MAWQEPRRSRARKDRGCSRGCRDALSSSRGLCKGDVSPHRFTGCCQLRHGGCSSPLLELIASRQRESFPWKKIFSEGSQKEIPEQPCQDPQPLERCSYALLSKPESSWLAAPRARQSEPSRDRLRGCWMNAALGGRRSRGRRALQPPPPPHRTARLWNTIWGLFLSVSADGLGLPSIQTAAGTQLGCHPGMRCDNFLEVHSVTSVVLRCSHSISAGVDVPNRDWRCCERLITLLGCSSVLG